MAVRRELVIDERGGFAAADKLMPVNETTQSNDYARRNETPRGKGAPANPLGRRPFLYRAADARFIARYRRLLHRCLTCGSLSVTFSFPFGSPQRYTFFFTISISH